MRIAVNTRLLLKDRLEGIGRFAFETLSKIARQHPEHEFYFIFDRPFYPDFIFSPNVKPVVMGPPARHPFLYVIWFEISLPRVLKRIKPDVFLSPDGFLSLSTSIPSVAVIHDLNFEYFPKDLPFLTRHYYKFFFPRFARKATRICTVSHFSKNDIAEKYRISSEKIDVVYNAASLSFQPLEEKTIHTIREKYTGGKPYFLFVGALHPRKNIDNQLKAFDVFIDETGLDFRFVVAGKKMWWTKKLQQTFEGLKHRDKVLFTGRLPEDELSQLVASAFALCYVSAFEGFGIPVVEAFACHVPVITSNTSSLPEVAGNAALLCDPFNPSSIAEAMKNLSSNQELRNALIEKGKHQLQKFSWEQSAKVLWECLQKTLQKS